jgi:hypothetical protein
MTAEQDIQSAGIFLRQKGHELFVAQVCALYFLRNGPQTWLKRALHFYSFSSSYREQVEVSGQSYSF